MFVTAPHIATQLGDSRKTNWLAAAYTLGVCSTQPLYGRLSDIFGRKYVLTCGYVLLATGCLLSGLGFELWHVIAGRIIAGLGGAGVMTMASVIITDSVPKSHIAQYRSYINMATTLGRSLGGPGGGYILDHFGWYWVFWSRLPILGLSLLMLSISLSNYIPHQGTQTSACMSAAGNQENLKTKLSKIDGYGSLYLVASIVSLMLLINQLDIHNIGKPMIASAAVLCTALPAFVYRQLYKTSYPVFDLRMLRKPNVAISYLLVQFQVMAQTALMFSVPSYFQITQDATPTTSGLHLVPAVAGNAIGSLIAGLWIRSTRRFKAILVAVGPIAIVTHLLMFFRWNGNTSLAESFSIVPGGLATGMAQSTAFVSMSAFLDQRAMAMATGAFFLVSSIGSALGILASSRVTQVLLEKYLRTALVGPDAHKVSDYPILKLAQAPKADVFRS